MECAGLTVIQHSLKSNTGRWPIALFNLSMIILMPHSCGPPIMKLTSNGTTSEHTILDGSTQLSQIKKNWPLHQSRNKRLLFYSEMIKIEEVHLNIYG